MGHTRLGRLPRTRSWRKVALLLADHTANADEVSTATLAAARRLLGAPKEGVPGLLSADPGLVFSFYVLAHTVFRSREADFLQALRQRGISVPRDLSVSAAAFVASVSQTARAKATSSPDATAFSEMAILSLRETLSEAIVDQSRTLFGTTASDVQAACRRYARTQSFGRLARSFFSAFLRRTVSFYLSREIAQHVGPAGRFGQLADVSGFERALRDWSYERARIIESFAGGWASKEDFESGITREGVERFMAIAVRKLGEEIFAAPAEG